MVSEDIIRKFAAKLKEKHKEISEPTIEKDFYICPTFRAVHFLSRKYL